ncbi:hypothetical protein CDL15_Pgr009281 [Punica granatum]|uniref:Uncharacterized protein n=1 Tax=Punica granatum TaxID=22663 RepID=A0A218WPH1_PUNGR|nr:hypothetical protein CDL15_Pgr009281 [Punica granatum]
MSFCGTHGSEGRGSSKSACPNYQQEHAEDCGSPSYWGESSAAKEVGERRGTGELTTPTSDHHLSRKEEQLR